MGQTKSTLWSHFLSLLHDRGDLKAYFNTSHKNAWCKYCIEYAIQNHLDDEEDMVGFDIALGTTFNHFRYQRRCMRDAKPLWGVNELMAKHMRDCEHQLDSVNLSTIPAATGTFSNQSQSQSQSSWQPRQSIL